MIKIYSTLFDRSSVLLLDLVDNNSVEYFFVESYKNLDCKNSIIIAPTVDANTEFDLTKRLLEQKNFFVFVNLVESQTPTDVDWKGLTDDLPELKKFPMIDGSDSKTDNLFGFESFLFLIYSFTNLANASDIIQQRKKQRPHNYLYLNCRDRPHRKALWNELQKKNLIHNSLSSYLYGVDPSNSSNSDDVPLTILPKKYNSKFTNHDPETRRNFFELQKRNLIALKKEFWNNQWLDGSLDPLDLYTDTYFSLVTETTCDPLDHFFITEKTFKPLLAGHPFIILGSPGIYSYLQNLGFKTFHGIIDESFDKEQDVNKRIKQIVSEVERLSGSDLDLFSDQCYPIVKYNQEHYQKIVYEKFFQKKRELNAWFDRVFKQGFEYVKS